MNIHGVSSKYKKEGPIAFLNGFVMFQVKLPNIKLFLWIWKEHESINPNIT